MDQILVGFHKVFDCHPLVVSLLETQFLDFGAFGPVSTEGRNEVVVMVPEYSTYFQGLRKSLGTRRSPHNDFTVI